MTAESLIEHRKVWNDKPVLRAIYQDYYEKIMSYARAGLSLEIGGGSGNLKEYAPEVITTDIVWMPWIDIAADAQSLPFADSVFDNIVMVDVLHHIEQPGMFMREAQRILKENGRLIVIEPAITPLSYPFYNWLHPEPVDMGVDPYADIDPDPDRMPFDSNQAIPTLMFGKYADKLNMLFPSLHLIRLEYFDTVAYPLSGGFRKWSLLPAFSASAILKVERKLLSGFSRLIAFRLLAVLEKTAQ